MSFGYIDTSFLLSILFEDQNYEKSIDCWNELGKKFSSILLEIESRINIYRYFTTQDKEKVWYQEKEKELQELPLEQRLNMILSWELKSFLFL